MSLFQPCCVRFSTRKAKAMKLGTQLWVMWVLVHRRARNEGGTPRQLNTTTGWLTLETRSKERGDSSGPEENCTSEYDLTVPATSCDASDT